MSEVRNAHWDNHSKILIGGLQKQLQQSELCDCRIVAEGQSLEAHKVILSACSPFFKSLFLQSPEKDVFVLHSGIKFRELKTLIEFVYYGELLFCDDTIEELIIAAEILQIRGLQGRSKACFQNTKKVVEEEKCPTESCEKVRFDIYQKDQKPSHLQMSATDGLVLKEEKEWVDCYNECDPQGTDPTHVDPLEAPQDVGRASILLTTQQEITAQILGMREGATSNPENMNRTAEEISQETYVQPHFSECSVILQDIWKEGIFQRDNKGDLIVSGIRCDFHPLVTSSKKMQSLAHMHQKMRTCTSKDDVNISTEEQDHSIPHTTYVNLPQQSKVSYQTHSLCSESSALLNNTSNHIRTRALENEHNCFECGKNFKCAFNLENHFWTHAVDRPFVCEICGKAFSVKGSYKRHVYVHSNERPYVCQGCGKRFKVVTGLQLHYRQHCGRHS